MRRERVIMDQLSQTAREKGHADLEQVVEIVLESDGTLSVLTDEPCAPGMPGESGRVADSVPRQ